jgi:hypothetical protein
LEDVSRNVKTGFLRWAILGRSPSTARILDSTGAVRVGFELALTKPLRMGHHGIGIYNADRNLIWGTAVDNLELLAGTHTLVHELPSLPLRPGPYTWRVSLWDEHGRLDDWQCVPEMLVTTEPVTHQKDEWAGVLNIPEKFSVLPGSVPLL